MKGYTQVRTLPPPPAPPLDDLPVETALTPEELNGEYSGTLLLVDETGHHIERVRFAFADGWYRAEVETLPTLEGEYELRPGEIILVDARGRDGLHDWRLAPAGHFAIRRTESGITLGQRLSRPGSYIELVLSREAPSR